MTEPMSTPWLVRHDEDDYWCVVDATGRVLFAQTGPQAEGIARIIAAAPSLLNALTVLANHCDKIGVPVHAARAAIAAATGKEAA